MVSGLQQGLLLIMEASGVLVPDEAFADLDVPERSQIQASALAEQLVELSLSSCPDNGVEDSDIEKRMSQRRFSRLLS